MRQKIIAAVLAAGLTSAAAAFPALAQDAPKPGLVFQLNNAQTIENSCQLTFVVQNATGVRIEKSAYNMAIVDSDGTVAMLITFEFKPFPEGQPKAQQFSLPGTTCENISAISINEFVSCAGGDGAKLTACEDGIVQSSRTAIEFPWVL